MTAKELMMPRFEVIAEYPKCEFKTGEILSRVKYATNDIYHTDENAAVGGLDLSEIEKYPHLFRKMNWWENRKSEDMPKQVYCKAVNTNEIFDIQEWDMSINVGWVNKERRECCDLRAFTPEYGYFPF